MTRTLSEGLVHRVFFARPGGGDSPSPALVLRLEDADARELARRVGDLDGISVCSRTGDRPGAVDVVGWAGLERLGVLTSLEVEPGAWQAMADRGVLVLALSGGGLEGGSLRREHMIWVREVSWVEDD